MHNYTGFNYRSPALFQDSKYLIAHRNHGQNSADRFFQAAKSNIHNNTNKQERNTSQHKIQKCTT